MDNSSDRLVIIRDNYNKIIDRINKTASSVGRDAGTIRLVVVTKTQPIDVIRFVIEAGATNLGENYVEEAIPKIEALDMRDKLSWHMIGHLQRRKADDFCNYFSFLHSLDSVRLAGKVNRFAEIESKTIPVWLEFNVAGEGSKSGWDISKEENWQGLLPELDQIIHFGNLIVLGVMAVPPISENPEGSRPYFQKLAKFQQYVISQLHPSNFQERSIGMSSDFEVAIEEGSTCVRIGQAILGMRRG